MLEDCRAELEAFHHHCELGDYAEAYQAMQTCYRFLHRAGYYSSLVSIYERLTEEWQASDNSEIENLGWAWIGRGAPYQSLGRVQDGIAAYQQAQQNFQSIACRQGEAAALGNLGLAYRSLGQYQQAIDFYQQSLSIACEIGDRQGEANALYNFGKAYHSLGQYQEALEKLNQAKQLFAAMELDHKVEECDAEINKVNQSLTAKLQPRQRIPLWVYFLIGLAIVLAIAWLL